MSDKIWYFSRGDAEHGPVTAKQIKVLATTGKLRGDDLVWREGMSDWAMAGEVTELFHDAVDGVSDTDVGSVPQDSEEAVARPTARRLPATLPNRLVVVRDVGIACIFAGLAIAMLARGCDVAHQRYAVSVQTRAAYLETSFNLAWDQKEAELDLRANRLQAADGADLIHQDQTQKVEEEKTALHEDKNAQQVEMEANTWGRVRQQAADAVVAFHAWRYWRSLIFLLGSLVLVGGLAIVTAKGVGPERWICLGVLAILVASLFVFGDAWDIPEFGDSPRSPSSPTEMSQSGE